MQNAQKISGPLYMLYRSVSFYYCCYYRYIVIFQENMGNIQVFKLKQNRKPDQALCFAGLSNLRTWVFMPMKKDLPKTLSPVKESTEFPLTG